MISPKNQINGNKACRIFWHIPRIFRKSHAIMILQSRHFNGLMSGPNAPWLIFWSLSVSFQLLVTFNLFWIKFIYSEKATIFCEISTVDLSHLVTVKFKLEISQTNCGLLRIYELYLSYLIQLISKSRKIPSFSSSYILRRPQFFAKSPP